MTVVPLGPAAPAGVPAKPADGTPAGTDTGFGAVMAGLVKPTGKPALPARKAQQEAPDAAAVVAAALGAGVAVGTVGTVGTVPAPAATPGPLPRSRHRR